MKSYLRNKRRQKEKNLKEINNLQSLMRNLSDKCVAADNCVRNVKLGIEDWLKSDNTGRLVTLSTNINKNSYKKIYESISLASTVKAKIQAEIDSIDRQIREIERQEEAERRRREAERRRRKII